jgi:hypothetical protein
MIDSAVAAVKRWFLAPARASVGRRFHREGRIVTTTMSAVTTEQHESEAREVLEAAQARARALADGDGAALWALLHPHFVWTSHRAERFDRRMYVEANTANGIIWHHQDLRGVDVRVVGDTAVLCATVVDDVTILDTRASYEMPVTQTWVHSSQGWQCLAGHAGPRLPVSPPADGDE